MFAFFCLVARENFPLLFDIYKARGNILKGKTMNVISARGLSGMGAIK